MTKLKIFFLAAVLTLPAVLQPNSVTARAITSTTNLSVPTEIVVFIPCANGGAGEFVLLTGDLHVLFHTTISNSGRITIKQHFQPQGISGVGETTGDKYQATGVTQQKVTFDGITGFPFNTTFVNNFRIIGQGPGNNFLVHETFHVTINANGVLTAETDNLKIECK